MRLYSDKYVIDYLNKHYDGKNLKQISRKLGYTCNWLQKVIKKNEIKKNDWEENKKCHFLYGKHLFNVNWMI